MDARKAADLARRAALTASGLQSWESTARNSYRELCRCGAIPGDRHKSGCRKG